MNENESSRLARIDEGVRLLRDTVDKNHELVLDQMKSLKEETDSNHTDITVLKRDRFWVFTLVGAAYSFLTYLLCKAIGA